MWWIIGRADRWLIVFFFAILLLPPLPIALGDTGPHPAILIAGIGVLVGAMRLEQWRGRLQMTDAALLAMLAALVVSLGFAAVYSGVGIAAASAARVGLFSIGAYVYFAAAHGPNRQTASGTLVATRLLYAFAAIAALFGCIDFLYQLPAPAGFEPQFLWLESGVYRRAQGLFYESSTLGNFCSFFLVFTAVCFADRSRRRMVPTAILCTAAVIFSAAMLLSFSRASVFACLFSLGVLALIERRRWFTRSALWVAGLASGAVITFASAVPEVAEGYWARFRGAFDNISDSPDQVLSGRLESWSTVLGFVSRSPAANDFGHRLQDASLHRTSGAARDRRQHVLVTTGRNRSFGITSVACSERDDSHNLVARDEARFAPREVDVLLLGRGIATDAERRHSDVLARLAHLLLGSRASGPWRKRGPCESCCLINSANPAARSTD